MSEARTDAASTMSHDLSPLGMFLAADVVVQAVMLGLAFAALLTWVVWLVKLTELRSQSKQLRRGLHGLRSAPTLSEAQHLLAGSVLAPLAAAAGQEAGQSAGLPAEGIKERVAARLGRLEAALGRRMNRGTGVLATIGATAPFVGLFGTVWGIMNSFIGIARSQTTNLAVVAPGIAEALLATALGLLAAIPAVVIYNLLARAITGYRAVLGDAATEVLNLVSRDLDRGIGRSAVP